MKLRLISFALFQIVAFSALFSQKMPTLPSRIAFGSCGHQDAPWPIMDTILRHRPELFIFLGDNIYGDTDDMAELQRKYDELGAKPHFQHLKKAVPLLAIWDDHDFGRNDSGRHYPFKKQSKAIFEKFWETPADRPSRHREGIYDARYFEKKGRRLQVILLDVRTFRDDLKPYAGEKAKDERFFYALEYSPQSSPDSTLLGAAQWAWLEEELKKPADLRLICSGSQFGITYNGYEAWANFPHEQQRMLDLLKKTHASGALFLTGDVHYSELSKLASDGLYPIYDATASGITSTWLFAAPNDNRIEGPVMENHVGLLTIDWKRRDPTIRMECIDARGNSRFEHTIRLSEISFK